MNLIMYSTNLENCAGGGVKTSTSSGTNRINIEKSTIQRSGPRRGIDLANSDDQHPQLDGLEQRRRRSSEASSRRHQPDVSVDRSTVSNNFKSSASTRTTRGTMRVTNTSIYFNNGIGMSTDAGGQMLTGNNNWLGGNAGGDGAKTGSVRRRA